jgi:small subunit ribosomal protein S27e
MPKDLLHPSAAEERRKHKLKRLVQSPNSFFMDVKCPGCFQITTVFSHAQVSALPQRYTLGRSAFLRILRG